MSNLEMPTLPDGTKNPKYVDVLEEDKPIAQQKFVCLSFISPESIIKQKNMFMFEEFLKYFDFEKSMEKFLQFLSFVSYKYDINMNMLASDYEEFVKDQRDKLVATTIEDDYKTFLDKHEDRLTDEFNKEHNFQTSVRGLKVRGVYPTIEEAELRCKFLREVDPNHDIHVGQVGLWMPLDPVAYRTGRVEHLEPELNELMHKKMENDENARKYFDQRVRDAKQKAINENIKKASESGNKLTQTIDEEGNLINIAQTSENFLNEDKTMTVDDVRRSLFEGEDVRTREGDKKREEESKAKTD